MYKNRIFLFEFSRLFDALKLARRAFGEYKTQIFILSFLGLLGGLLEAIGVNALIPLFSFFVESDDRAGTDFIAVSIEKVFVYLGVPFTLPTLLVFICLLFLLKALATFYFDYLRINIRTEYERKTMEDLYKETLSADWPYLSKQKLGHLETVIMTNVRQAGGLLENIARTIGVVTAFSMYLIVALNISQVVTFFTLVIGAFMFLVFKPLLYKVRKYSEQTEKLNKEVSRHVNESIWGIKSIKSMGSEQTFIEISNKNFSLLRRIQMKAFAIQNMTLAFIQPVGVVFISIVVAFSYYQTSYNLGALAAIIYLIQKMFSHVQSLQSFSQMITGAIPYVQGVLEYRDQAFVFREKNNTGEKPFAFNKEIIFNKLSFEYDSKNKALVDVNLKIPKGSMVGVIGKSGAGKTTLFDILLRLLKPTSGSVSLDGNNIQDLNLEEWRNQIAYVPQDTFLLNDTIYNNIVFGDKSIKKSDVESAIKQSYLDDFVQSLPESYNTIVGERGVRLSGGQKQRIAIARALVRNPEILLLDEATSALDIESEKFIQQAIEDLKGRVTILVIAHRLSTVANSDSLIVLDGGKIVESGSPHDLLKDRETYYSKLYGIRS